MQIFHAALLSLIASAAAGAAAAQQAPAYYAAPAHPLAVRAAPGGETIGALAPGAAPLETTARDASGAWARIGFGEGDGWVAVDALTPVEIDRAPYADAPLGLVCAGVEPFWALRFTADGVAQERPGEAPTLETPSASAVAQGAARWPLALRLDTLIAVLRPQACSDGMSDRTDAWTLDLIAPGEDALALRSGCCRLPAAQ